MTFAEELRSRNFSKFSLCWSGAYVDQLHLICANALHVGIYGQWYVSSSVLFFSRPSIHHVHSRECVGGGMVE